MLATIKPQAVAKSRVNQVGKAVWSECGVIKGYCFKKGSTWLLFHVYRILPFTVLDGEKLDRGAIHASVNIAQD